MDKYIGKRLDGRYVIKEIIGVGGMAVVYKAYDNIEDRIVAIKILKEEFVSNEEFLRRFRNESKAIAMLSHPNIVKVYDVSFGDLIQYIVMEYIDGITLKEYIEQQGSLRWKDAVHFTIQILRGLQHAHDKGIVHRDVKPQNIMVLPDGTIKVTDFGIARFARSEQRTITDKAIGSVHYISPEQARGETTDEKADVYSVGVMLYEMLTGQLPFQAESAVSVAIMQLQRDPTLPREINGSIPLGLEQITMHAMQKDPSRRYQSAAEMLCDLEAFKKDPAITFQYNYFVDDAPTRFVTAEGEEAEPAEEETETNEKSPIIPILAGVATTFVIAIVAVLIFFLPKLFGGSGDEIPCPDFKGLYFSDVETDEEYAVFELNDEWDYNTEYEYGYIYDQSQPADKKLKEGAKITLYVSLGKKTVKVPDVYGHTSSLAVSELKAEGFVPVIQEMPDEEVAKNVVISTNPTKGTSVYEGTEVVVYVSSGKPTTYVDLKDFVGMSEDEAKEMIERVGLKVGSITPVNSTKPKGVVVSQSPAYEDSKRVPLGSKVDLEVSTGEMEYSFSVKVPMPSDYVSDVGYVSLWINNGSELYEESNKIDINALSDYTFHVTTKEKTMKLIVKLSPDGKQYDDYIALTIIDASTGEVQITNRYNYPTKQENTSSDNSSDTSTSSEESSSSSSSNSDR